MEKNYPKVTCWILQIIAAVIMASAGGWKFYYGDSEMVFTRLGMEPWGRFIIGSLELLCAFLLVSRMAAVGAFVSVGIMLGAIFAHLTVIGVVVNDDGGVLFGQLFVVLFSTLLITWFRRKELPILGKTF